MNLPRGEITRSPIGQTFVSGGPVLWLTTAICTAVVAAYLAFVAAGRLTIQGEGFLAAVVILSTGSVALYRRDAASFGFRFSPIQGWTYWAKVTMIVGAVLFIVILAFAAVFLGVFRFSVPVRYHYVSHPSQIWPLFVSMCILAPLLEETVFRLAICPVLAVRLGPSTAIVVSGIAFAALHVLAGIASPDNLIAGFILAWAFLKSGTLVVPMALHSLGNACAWANHVAYFYWCS
jgi:membrane protease YdiL (CAAX protease family)